MSFWVRLFLTFTLCLLFTLLLLGVYLIVSISDYQSQGLTEYAINQANWVSYDISYELQRINISKIESFLHKKYGNISWMILVDTDGEIISSTGRPPGVDILNYPELIESRKGSIGHSVREVDGNLYVVVALPVIMEDTTVAHLILHYPATVIQTSVVRIIKFIISTFLFALVLGAILIFFSMQYQTKPLLKLIDDARAISSGEMNRKFTTSGTDEVAQLSRALQIMVSRLKIALNVAREEQSRFDAVFTNMMDGLVVADAEGRIILANSAFLTMFGITLAELAGFDVRKCNLPKEIIESIIFTQQEKEMKITKPTERIIRIRSAPIDESDEAVGSITICEDITRIKALEASEREFTQYISHELKTPLTSLSATVETLQDMPDDNPKIRHKFLGNLSGDIERLKKLVNSIITFQRTRDTIDELERFGAVDIVMEVHGKFLAYAHKIGVYLDMELPDDEINVIANYDRIMQVLTNLVDNAIRFTLKDGRVEIGIRYETNRVLFWVLDTGIGIPEYYLDKLGERFIKIPRKNHKYDTQVGLGLSICMEILNRHGSRLEVESKEGKGSKFSFYLRKA